MPWVIIGDSSASKKTEKVLLTGTVTGSNHEKIVGATLSLDLFKYFDYSDIAGKYLLEIPPGRYRLTVRHVGMLPIYLRMKVFSSGLLHLELKEGIVDLEGIVISSRAMMPISRKLFLV